MTPTINNTSPKSGSINRMIKPDSTKVKAIVIYSSLMIGEIQKDWKLKKL